MLRDNIFYLALGVGAVAIIAVLTVYNLKSKSNDQAKNQNIDLNEPVQEMAKGTDDIDMTEEVQETLSDDADMDVPQDMIVTHEEAEETITPTTEEAVPTGNNVVSLNFAGTEKISWPVIGNAILPYSMDTTIYFPTLDQYRCNPGMMIQADQGCKVVSIWKGKVVKVEDTKEYGTMVSVDLGNGYMAQYGQLADVRVEDGDMVYQDTILGVVAAPTAYYTEEGSHVYFAMTKDNTPMNPMELLQPE